VVGTLANALLAQLREPNGVEHHRIMKPSSWNKQLGWSRCWNAQRAEGGQDQNPSWQQTGLDASYHICVSLEVRGEVFLLTSPFIGPLTAPLPHRQVQCEITLTSTAAYASRPGLLGCGPDPAYETAIGTTASAFNPDVQLSRIRVSASRFGILDSAYRHRAALLGEGASGNPE